MKKSLLIASPNSIGNVGQLTVDLLISSLNLPFNRYVASENLVPIVGTDFRNIASTGSTSNLSAPVEIYEWNSVLEIMQIRSLPIDSQLFAAEILEYVKASGYERVYVLCGLSAVELTCSGVYDSHKNSQQGQGKEEKIELVGSGYLTKLLHANGARVFGVFCTEGDNLNDAVTLFQYLSTVLDFPGNVASYPKSWNSFYGSFNNQLELY